MVARLVLLAALALSTVACGVLGPEPTQDSGLACNEPPEGNWQVRNREIPDVTGTRPAEAAAQFAREGIAVTWRYSYETQAAVGGTQAGYAECWCMAPPDGVVQDVVPSDKGWLIVMVARGAPISGGRPQPRLGWGCEEAGEPSASVAT